MTREEQFDAFWKAYPRRVAKGHARDAFDKAIRLTTLETMLTAVRNYIRFKPDRIDFKHPATWLRAESWDDEWQAVPKEVSNRKPTVVDAMQQIFEERGWTNGPGIVRGNIIDDHGVSTERGERQGAVVDLRAGAYRRG